MYKHNVLKSMIDSLLTHELDYTADFVRKNPSVVLMEHDCPKIRSVINEQITYLTKLKDDVSELDTSISKFLKTISLERNNTKIQKLCDSIIFCLKMPLHMARPEMYKGFLFNNAVHDQLLSDIKQLDKEMTGMVKQLEKL